MWPNKKNDCNEVGHVVKEENNQPMQPINQCSEMSLHAYGMVWCHCQWLARAILACSGVVLVFAVENKKNN